MPILIYALFKFFKCCMRHAEFNIKENTASSGENLFLISPTEGSTKFFVD